MPGKEGVWEMRVNGEERALGAPQDILAFLAAQGYDPQRVAVERNGEIVPRAAFGDVLLAEGDRLEVVAFVGGG